MRAKLTRRQIIGSLVFPVGIMIWALFNYIWAMLLGGFYISGPYLTAIVFGGILPIILTFAMGIDTAQYFLPRLLIFISTIGILAVSTQFVLEIMLNGGAVLMIIVSIIFAMVYFYKIQPTGLSEWIIISLTNPFIYYLIDELLYWWVI